MFNSKSYQAGQAFAQMLLARRQAAQTQQAQQPVPVQQLQPYVSLNENDRIYYAIRRTMVDGRFYPAEDLVKDPYYRLDDHFSAAYDADNELLEVKFKVPSGKEAKELTTLGGKLVAALQYREVERYSEPSDTADIVRFRFSKSSQNVIDFGGKYSYPLDSHVDMSHIPFGLDSKGNTVELKLYEKHLLLAGQSGAGKSGGSSAIIAGLARLDNIILLGIDLKQVELSLWEDRFSGIAYTQEEAAALLRALKKEMTSRYRYLKGNGLKKFPLNDPDYPPIVIIIDEVAELFRSDSKEEKEITAEIKTLLTSIAQVGRASAINIIMMTQVPKAEVINTQLRDQLQIRIAYRTANAGATSIILGDASQDNNEPQPHDISSDNKGTACYREGDGTNKLIKTYWLEDEDLVDIVKQTAKKRIKIDWLNDLYEARFQSEIGQLVELGEITPDLADAIYRNSTPETIVEALTPKEKKALLNVVLDDIALENPLLQRAFFGRYDWNYKDMDKLVNLLEEEN